MENQQARKMQEAFEQFEHPERPPYHGQPVSISGSDRVPPHPGWRGVAGDERLVKAALATDLFGVDGAQLSACTESQWQEWLQRFHEYLDLWDGRGFLRMFRHWLQREGVRQRLLAFRTGNGGLPTCFTW